MTAQPVDGPGGSVQEAFPFDVEHIPDATATEVDALLSAGESGHEIAARLGVKLDSLRKHLTRHGRVDLLARLSAVTAPGGGVTPGNPGARPRTAPPARVLLTDDPDALPCQDGDPEVWFSAEPADRTAAQTACMGCRVRARCLAGAVARREPWGVWGGRVFVAGEPL